MVLYYMDRINTFSQRSVYYVKCLFFAKIPLFKEFLEFKIDYFRSNEKKSLQTHCMEFDQKRVIHEFKRLLLYFSFFIILLVYAYRALKCVAMYYKSFSACSTMFIVHWF